MYYLVSVDHNSMEEHLTRSECERCRASNAQDGTDGDMLWNGCKENGNIRFECGEDEGTGGRERCAQGFGGET